MCSTVQRLFINAVTLKGGGGGVAATMQKIITYRRNIGGSSNL